LAVKPQPVHWAPASPEAAAWYDGYHYTPTCPDGETKLWRYLTLDKFIGLLTSSALHFARPSSFTDELEGSYPQVSVQRRPETVAELLEEATRREMRLVFRRDDVSPLPIEWKATFKELIDDVPHLAREALERTFISCWCACEHELEQFWESYSSRSNGIVVQTTVGRLQASIAKCPDCEVTFGLVEYVDFDEANIIPFRVVGNSIRYDPVPVFFHKRREFSHDREFRVVISLAEAAIPPKGLPVPVSLENLFTCVTVAPDSGDWYLQSIIKLLKQFDLEVEVRPSSLRRKAVF
jgi:hypothetical protein